MERFFDGTDQENSKTQGGKGQFKKNQNKQEGKNGRKKKKRFLHTWRFPYSCFLHHFGTSSYNPPSGEPTHMGTSPSTKCPSKNAENEANREGGIMKKETPHMVLDEKICFIRLPPDTLQNFW
jgi:hypothetical protein